MRISLLIIIMTFMTFPVHSGEITVYGKGMSRCSEFTSIHDEFERLRENGKLDTTPAGMLISNLLEKFIEYYYGVATGMQAGFTESAELYKDNQLIDLFKQKFKIPTSSPMPLIIELADYCRKNPTEEFYTAVRFNIYSYF